MSAIREAMSHAVLGWVKPELDETLRLARAEVESFVEEPDDTTRMNFCAGYLHQVQGTLRMVELYAPAMVAEELELLARALQDGSVVDRDEACGTLMRGTVLLPDYLERLQGGHRDIPIVLLPLLNDIRTARGAPGLNESVLFAPDLEQPLPTALPLPEVLSWPARQNRVQEAQEQFEQVLSEWPEDAAPAVGASLAAPLTHLLSSVESVATRRMLWVASSVAEALDSGALAPTPALRQAYAGVSRAVRAVQEGGIGAVAPSQEPTRQLLYLVSRSSATHPALDELRQAFALDDQSPSEAELDHARGSISGRNRALLDTVGGVVKEELLRIKDALDLHLRTGGETAALQGQVGELGNVADTLGMMGLGVARGVVLQQRDALNEMVQGSRPADEGTLLDIAGALLYVDASLDDQVTRLGEGSGGSEELASSESQRTVEILAQEAIHNFAGAREGFVAFIETNWDHGELAEVPRLLAEVAGALRMLDMPEPADYLLGVRQYVAVELIGKRRVPGGQQLDTLADAMASLEYYLEALRERRPNRDEILDITRSSLEKLRYWPIPAEEVLEPAPAVEENEVPAVAEEEAGLAIESLDFDAGDAVDHDSVVAVDEGFDPVLAESADNVPDGAVQEQSPVFEWTLDEVEAALPTLPDATIPAIVVPAAVATLSASAGGFELAGSDIDDDIREVFLEEFDEEIVNLRQLLPAWTAAPENMERLRPIRRVFHTLKGSGRLVGAKLLGEFSWKIENMLNRVLDGTREPTPAVTTLLEQATDVLPQLNAALRGQGAVQADLAALQELSDRIADGEEVFHDPNGVVVSGVDAVDEEALSVGAGSSEAFVVDAEGTPVSLDGVLREILDTEISGHLETVDGWLSNAQSAPALADESLVRALHTMNGAFAMADVPEITEVTGTAEQYVKRLLSAGESASPEGVLALADSARAIRHCMLALQAPAPRVAVSTALAARLAALRDALPEARASAVTVDNSSQHGYTETLPSIVAPIAPGVVDLSVPRGDVELSVHDLSAFVDKPAPVSSDEFEVDATESVEAESVEVELDETSIALASETDDQVAESTGDLEFDEHDIVFAEEETATAVEAGLPQPDAPVTFFEMDLSYMRVPVAAGVVVGTAAAIDAAGSEAAEPAIVEETSSDAVVEAADIAELQAIDGDEEATTSVEAVDESLVVADETSLAEAPALEQNLIEEAAEEDRLIEEAVAEPAAELVQEDAAQEPVLEAEAEAEQSDEIEAVGESLPVVEDGDADVEAVVPDADAIESSDEAQAAADEASELPDSEALLEADSVAFTRLAAVTAVAAAATQPDDALDFTELDSDLVDIFVEEANDLLDHSDSLLASLREAPEDRSPVIGLQRNLHTIKGGARMAGINAVGDLGHAIESLLEQVAAQRVDLDQGNLQLLERGFDNLHGLVARVGAHRTAPMPTELIAEFESRARGEATATTDEASVATEDKPAVPSVVLAPLSAPIDTVVHSEDESQPYAAQEQVRVRADLLDRLVNNAGEVAIYRARLEQQLGAFRGAMAELDRTNTRLHDQLRRLDLETEAQIVARYQREQDKRDPTFDPLELDRFSTLQQLSRGLAESAADLTGLQGVLDELARQYDGLLHQQSRVSSELQDGLMRARMVPFDGLVPRLRRVLRQAASDTGKQVKLQLDGAHGELDRNVLERMTAPLEHLLRNAVAHGLESPKARRKAGKQEEGMVQVALRREGAEMVLQVSDDGSGIDHAAVRRRAEQRGLVQPDAVVSNAELERFILESGFSTSDNISQLSGRGVGMDVVHSEVRQLGGLIEITSNAGKGTTFSLRLPQTLAVTQAVFVQVGDTQFAVPVAAVGGVGRISRERFESEGAVYVYGGEEYVLHDLGLLVGQTGVRAEGQAQIPLLLVRAGDLRAAVAVDQVLGNREIVVKPVGPQIASVPGIYGATITGDGSIVVILDVAPLVRRHIQQPRLLVSSTPVAQERRVPLVMVVDDSLTMRKVTGRVLERHNFEVSVARDGVEALERLEERVPDLMLLDIEMPRMDGYELATAMKADPRFKDVPIVMITSRTGDKHRQRAIEIGVQRYMGKPYQELDLMRNVYDLLGIARVRE